MRSADEPAPLHLIKLAAGIRDLDGLRRSRGHGHPFVIRTRNMPKRAAEILGGGSLYWVAGGSILARQALLDIGDEAGGDGHRWAVLTLAPQLVPVRPVARSAFQGWRYLPEAEAPADLATGAADSGELAMPEALRRELMGLGLL